MTADAAPTHPLEDWPATVYLVGCAGCGGSFIIPSPLPRISTEWDGIAIGVNTEPWLCARCASLHSQPDNKGTGE